MVVSYNFSTFHNFTLIYRLSFVNIYLSLSVYAALMSCFKAIESCGRTKNIEGERNCRNFEYVAVPRNRPPHSHAASEKLNSVVRVVQTGPPAPSTRTKASPKKLTDPSALEL